MTSEEKIYFNLEILYNKLIFLENSLEKISL
jgi:hypothetical protein